MTLNLRKAFYSVIQLILKLTRHYQKCNPGFGLVVKQFYNSVLPITYYPLLYNYIIYYYFTFNLPQAIQH